MVFGSRTTLVLVYTLYLCLFFVRSTTTLKQPRYENRIANYFHRSVDSVQCVHQRSHWPVTTLTYSNEYEGCKLGTKHRSRKSSSSYYPQHECPIHLFTSNFFFIFFDPLEIACNNKQFGAKQKQQQKQQLGHSHFKF